MLSKNELVQTIISLYHTIWIGLRQILLEKIPTLCLSLGYLQSVLYSTRQVEDVWPLRYALTVSYIQEQFYYHYRVPAATTQMNSLLGSSEVRFLIFWKWDLKRVEYSILYLLQSFFSRTHTHTKKEQFCHNKCIFNSFCTIWRLVQLTKANTKWFHWTHKAHGLTSYFHFIWWPTLGSYECQAHSSAAGKPLVI